jgi:hypothetical protein
MLLCPSLEVLRNDYMKKYNPEGRTWEDNFDSVTGHVEEEFGADVADRMRSQLLEKRQLEKDTKDHVDIVTNVQARAKKKIENKKNMEKRIREAMYKVRQDKMSRQGSLVTPDGEWLCTGKNILLDEDHSEHGDTIMKNRTMLRYWKDIPNEICAVCCHLICDEITKCEEDGNEWASDVCQQANVTMNELMNVVRSNCFKKIVFQRKSFPGCGKRSVKISKNKAEKLRNIFLAVGCDPTVTVKIKGQSQVSTLSLIDGESLLRWATYTGPDARSDYRQDELTSLTGEWAKLINYLH